MRYVLVTGSNRGIGLGLVREFLVQGDRVFATCRSPEMASELNQLQQKHAELLTVMPLEVTNKAAIESVINVVKGFSNRLDILVNNAGVGGGENPLGELSEDNLVQTFRVNAVAPLMLVQALLPLLKRGDRPIIANVTSRMGSIADNKSSGSYAYRASKAALNMINKNLAIDVADKGIISVVIHPGWVQTDMGGRSAHITVEESARGIIEVIDGLTLKDSGRFLVWDGSELPW